MNIDEYSCFLDTCISIGVLFNHPSADHIAEIMRSGNLDDIDPVHGKQEFAMHEELVAQLNEFAIPRNARWNMSVGLHEGIYDRVIRLEPKHAGAYLQAAKTRFPAYTFTMTTAPEDNPSKGVSLIQIQTNINPSSIQK
jgi:hypothetical protein